ncbi:hypothetical protein GcLGCM259_1666 [Glutamicibacter creatinolyticus]|uniref:Uncharacterized protein n=1 Tax=Glutamicibacter creatinolyticus TaxID=162496 RepID=A0A5B7WW09_9MICC|nr:hypothetical protein GcLGCM259_1666 [Glutamicibacter creatinolyticus]
MCQANNAEDLWARSEDGYRQGSLRTRRPGEEAGVSAPSVPTGKQPGIRGGPRQMRPAYAVS